MTKEQKRLKYYEDMIKSIEDIMYPCIKKIEGLTLNTLEGYDSDMCISRLDAELVDLYANTLGRLYYHKFMSEEDLNYDENNI